MKKALKRTIVCLLVAAMFFTAARVEVYAATVDKTTKVVENGRIRVTYTLTSCWNTGYNANVKVENISDSLIHDWYIVFESKNKITNIWNAQISEQKGQEYTVKNAVWNQDIAAGRYVEFGLSSNAPFLGFPENYMLLGEIAETEKTDYKTEYVLYTDWGSGYSAAVMVTNQTNAVIEDWVIEFDYNRNITEIWNAVIESHVGNHYVIRNAGYNENIFAGQTINFGFNGNGGNRKDAPLNIVLYSYSASYDANDKDGDGLSNDIELILGTNPMNADTDKDGIKDGDEDLDDDSLTNLEELSLGTDALKADSDEDGLSDGEEVKTYNTNPLKADSDEDGLGDGEEVKTYNTNPLKADSDEDGISDIEEIKTRGTNPLKADSDEDGLSDAEELETYNTDPLKADCDEDGLNDGEEIKLYNTDPFNPDCDEDGLSDGEEVKTYHSDPLKVDGDDDGLTDVDEVKKYHSDPLKADGDDDGLLDVDEIVRGLDPMNPITDGVTPDIERLFEQTLSVTRIEASLFDENDTVPSVRGMVPGYIDKNVSVNAAVISAISSNRAVAGKELELVSSYPEDIKVELRFDCSGSDQETDLLVVLKYEDGKITPCETFRDESSVWANVTSGKYFVANAETLLIDFGIPIVKYKNATGDLEGAANRICGQADIVFVFDTTGSMSSPKTKIINNVDKFISALIDEHCVNANLALVDYKDITVRNEYTVLCKNGTSNWFNDARQFKSVLQSLKITGGGDTPETTVDALAMANSLDFRESADKFIILITDAGYKVDNNYGIKDMNQMIDELVESEITTSVITNSSSIKEYTDLYVRTGGVYGSISSDFGTVLIDMAKKIGESVNDGTWVVLSDYQTIKLDRPLADDGYSSDEDDLSDKEELGEAVETDISLLIDAVLDYYNFPKELYKDQTTITVYNYISNPIISDTDLDGGEE